MEASLSSEQEGLALRHRATLQAEALWVVDEGPHFEHYAALGVGLRSGVRWEPGTLRPAVGPRLSYSQRVGLPGSLANAVRLEADWAPTFLVSEGVRHEASASLRVEVWVARWGRRSLRLSPRAQVRWEGTLAHGLEGQVLPRVDLAVELL